MHIVFAKVLKTMSDKYFVRVWGGTKKIWIPKSEVEKKQRCQPGLLKGVHAFTVSYEFAVDKGLIG